VTGTLQSFVEDGKIGGFGFSEIAPSSLRLAHAVAPVTAVQSEYSLWTRQPELGMVEACSDLGVALVAFCPLGRGIFASQAPDPATFGAADFRKHNPRFVEPNLARNIQAVAPFKAYAGDLGTTPVALAIAWLLSRGGHVIPIPGTRSATHLEECVKGAELRLGEKELGEIDRILPPGFAHGDRYSREQSNGVEGYC
jgi:aryl-alcohol dehydrogenase-like predicted oxidoreductase